ncbi:MAG: (d)CMP kinase [Chloroflexi bacterium]|nr:(d)CMP kinase [Chloroflexota bacterium]
MRLTGVIAIDGPAASGKTAVGRILAQRLRHKFLDTGSMYRATTWMALKKGVDLTSEEELSRLVRELKMEIISVPGDGERLLVNGEDVTGRLRDTQVEKWVSPVSKVLGVRRALIKEQRRLARREKMVMAGRDIGTVVFPKAQFKIFLMASPEERARRRYLELENLGHPVSYAAVLEELNRRDRMDTERRYSPLKPATDAHVLDTEGFTIEEVVDRIMAFIEGR